MNPSRQSTLENWMNGLCLLFSVLLTSQKNMGLFHKTTQSGLRLLYVTCYRCTGLVSVQLRYIYLMKHEDWSIKSAIWTVVPGHAHVPRAWSPEPDLSARARLTPGAPPKE